jgi:GT2 family glycosyltransferase
MINKRSNYLVILVATYNRLHLLRRVVDSIIRGTRCSFEIIVIDGGSTDGTIEYLKSHPDITPVFQGKLLGTARAYNRVWRHIESKYTCWLSDDTEVVEGSLDLAVNILESNPEIGMVGLKMKDVVGPWKNVPYMGSVSMYGIINCNHGVLRVDSLRSVGYFNESYRAYMIDPDLTASILCTGKSVVLTKSISILHHREWAENVDVKDKIKREQGGINNKRIYMEKFSFLRNSPKLLVFHQQRSRLHRHATVGPFHVDSDTLKMCRIWLGYLRQILFLGAGPDAVRLGLNWCDWNNLIYGRFVRLTDPLDCKNFPYYLVQRLPRHLLLSGANPYRHLVELTHSPPLPREKEL